MSDSPHRYGDKRAEDNNRVHGRCAKCKRLDNRSALEPGPAAFGPDGQLIYPLQCRGGCLPLRTDHFNAKPPKEARAVPPYLDDKEPPRRRNSPSLKRARPVASSPAALKADLARMEESAKSTRAFIKRQIQLKKEGAKKK